MTMVGGFPNRSFQEELHQTLGALHTQVLCDTVPAELRRTPEAALGGTCRCQLILKLQHLHGIQMETHIPWSGHRTHLQLPECRALLHPQGQLKQAGVFFESEVKLYEGHKKSTHLPDA